jgi:protein phosphatase PTC6
MKHSGTPFSIQHALQTLFAELHTSSRAAHRLAQRRHFHDYFVTHLPSTSLSPDRAHPSHHKLPRSQSTPHSGPAHRSQQLPSTDRETTVVRIPLKSAKHHFGAGVSRGSRPYNEDTFQAGTVEIPAFAQKQPVSISGKRDISQNMGSTRATGDPQVFYFGVFDGHGGSECSEFLRDRLHAYIEEAALLFGMESTLQKGEGLPEPDVGGGIMGEQDAEDLQKSVVSSWKETVGGYFKRFNPEYFPALAKDDDAAALHNNSIETVLTYAFLKADLDFTTAQAAKHSASASASAKELTLREKAAASDDPVMGDRPLNDSDILFHPEREASQNLRGRPAPKGSSPDLDSAIGGSTRFKGGSTASIALLSTPSPTPFWHPNSPSTLVVAHVGDTRILLCRTQDGSAVPLTSNHHPSLPTEARRLRRYAASFVTDSFGEERVLGLANTRAFGDIGSKRIGVSAEPQITTTHLGPAAYAFLVLVSDGVSGHLEDQEIVDIVKEAKTPDQAAAALVGFATETSADADNATALVVRLGGWERRNEGGGGSMGTKEQRDYRQTEANDPRSRRH